MIIADRFHLLAIQAVKRIELLNMDPVESIRRALVYATSERVPYIDIPLTALESKTVLVMGTAPQSLSDIAALLGLSRDTAYQRLKRLCLRGVIERPRPGFWRVRETPAPLPPRPSGRPRTQPRTVLEEQARERRCEAYRLRVRRQITTDEPKPPKPTQ